MSALLPLLAEPAVGEEGWTALLSWGGVTACTCALVMLLARTLLPLLVPEGWSAMISKKAAHATPCSKHVTEWIPGLVVPYLVTRDMIAMTRDAIANPAHSLLLAPRPGLWSATGAILGYMAFDCVVMAVWRRETISSGGKAMYMQLWGHHVLSLLFWPYALAKKRGCILVAWFLFSEGSNLLLTWRTLFIKLQHASSPYFMAVSLGWLLSFILTRIVPLPMLAWLLAVAELPSPNVALVDKVMLYVTGPLPLVLNLYWLTLALGGLIKVLKGGLKGTRKPKQG